MKTPLTEITVLHDNDATVARVRYRDSFGKDRYESASAKRHPKDRYDHLTGEHYAVGRALVAMGERLIRDADQRVNERPLVSAYSAGLLDYHWPTLYVGDIGITGTVTDIIGGTNGKS